MASVLSEGLVYAATVTVPDAGDPLTVASVKAAGTGFQALVDRTNNLANRLGGQAGTADYLYVDATGAATPRQQFRFLSPMCGVWAAITAGGAVPFSQSATGSPPSAGYRLRTEANNAAWHLDLNTLLPDGGRLKRLRFVVTPGAARTIKSTNPGDNGRMAVTMYRVTPDLVTPSMSYSGIYLTGSVEDDGTTNLQVIDTGAIDHAIDKTSDIFVVRLQCGNDAGTNKDLFHALAIDYQDPGPRNF